MFLTMFHGFVRILEVAANANNQGAGLQLNDCKVSLKSVTISSSKFKHNISTFQTTHFTYHSGQILSGESLTRLSETQR